MQENNLPPVRVMKLKKLKRIHLAVHPQEGVIVKIPLGTSNKKAQQTVIDNQHWLQKQWLKSQSLCPWREYRDGDLLPLLDSRVVLVRETSDQWRCQWQPGSLVVQAPKNASRDQVRQLVSDCYRVKARQYIPFRVQEINQQCFRVSLGKISVRNQSRTLGSCSGQGNFASGVIIITLRPFNIGDFVTIAGESGIIEEIQFFNTQLRTLDNKVMYIPNSRITGSVIVNFSARDTRRLDLSITVSHDSDIEKAQQIVLSLLAADPRIHEDPAPIVGLMELNDTGAVLTIRPWVNRTDFFQVQFDLLGAIKKEFDKQGISFGRPRRDVLIQK